MNKTDARFRLEPIRTESKGYTELPRSGSPLFLCLIAKAFLCTGQKLV